MRMHGTTDEQDVEVQTEIRLINQAMELEAMNSASKWVDLFKNKPETQNFRRIMLGWWYVLPSGLPSYSH
jgi:hypothetical protein